MSSSPASPSADLSDARREGPARADVSCGREAFCDTGEVSLDLCLAREAATLLRRAPRHECLARRNELGRLRRRLDAGDGAGQHDDETEGHREPSCCAAAVSELHAGKTSCLVSMPVAPCPTERSIQTRRLMAKMVLEGLITAKAVERPSDAEAVEPLAAKVDQALRFACRRPDASLRPCSARGRCTPRMTGASSRKPSTVSSLPPLHAVVRTAELAVPMT